MTLTEAVEEIEELLKESTEEDILYICNTYFDEENFGDDLSEGVINDMYNIIISEASSNKNFSEEVYEYLSDEKIIIEEDELYLEEELDYE